MEQPLETYYYTRQLQELWKVDVSDLRRWRRDGLLLALKTTTEYLFHIDDIRKFETKHATQLLRARCAKEVDNIRKTQLAFDFSTLIQDLDAQWVDKMHVRRGEVFHQPDPERDPFR